jgi:hypothetical protein
MKKLILLAGFYCLQPALHAAISRPSAKINPAPLSTSDRAMAHFKEHYGDIQNVSWFNNKDRSMFCVFHEGNYMTHVFYDKQGYWQGTLVNYTPAELVSDIKDLVMDNFAGYTISYVNEIRLPGEAPAYVINIEDANHIKVVQVVNGEIDITEDLIKS